MKTYTPTPRDIERRWYVVDADGAVLGRLASEVAQVLRGKHKPMFAPHVDTGDHVVVVNARGVRLTGGKEMKKVAYRHSGYPGGLKETGYDRLLAQRPVFVVEKAIRGMLPKNRLGRAMARKLVVYEGPEHPHQAQKPVPLALGQLPEWTGLPEPAPRRAPEAEPKKAAPRGKARTRVRAKPTARATGRAGGTAAKRTTAKRTTAKRTSAKRTAAPKAPTAARTRGRARAEAAPAGEKPKPKRTRRAKKEES